MSKTCVDTNKFTVVFTNGENTSTITIEVNEYRYNFDKTSYYYINYYNKFSGEENRVNDSHPFFDTKYIEHLTGDIIFKNSYTQELIKMLLMNNSDLKTHIRENVQSISDYSVNPKHTVSSINTLTNISRFYPTFYMGEDNDIWCDITINIETLLCKDVYIYRITYNCQNNTENPNSSYYKKFNTLSKKSHIIYKNNLTTELVKIIMMNNEELSLCSGRTTPEKYKLSLIHFINMMHKVTNVNEYRKNIMKHICKLFD